MESVRAYSKDTRLLEKASDGEDRIQVDLKKKTAISLSLYFPTVVIQGVAGMATAVVLSKLFSPSHYGNFVLAQGIFSIFSALFGLWLVFSIDRLVPEYKSKGRYHELVFTLMVSEAAILCLAVTIALVGLISGRPAVDMQLFSLIIVTLVGGVFQIGSSSIEEFYKISGYPAKCSALILFRILTGLGLGLMLSLGLGWGIVGFFVGLMIPHAAVVLWFTILKRARCMTTIYSHRFSKAILKDAMTYSLPIVGLNIMAMILVISDRYVILGYLEARDVGIYSMAYLIASQGIQLIVNVLTMTAYPIVITAYENYGAAVAYTYLARLLQYYALLAIPGVVGLFVLSKELLTVLSTPAYAVAAPIIGYVGLGMVAHGWSQLMTWVNDIEKKTVSPFINFTIAGVVNVLLNVLLVPAFGYVAAGWSALASYLLLSVLIFRTTRHMIPFPLWGGYLWKIAASAIVMGLVAFVCKSVSASMILNLVITIAVSIGCYAALILLLGAVDIKDVWELRGGAKRVVCRSTER